MGVRADGKPITPYVGSWADRVNKEPMPATPTDTVLVIGTCNADGSNYTPLDTPIEKKVASGTYIWLENNGER